MKARLLVLIMLAPALLLLGPIAAACGGDGDQPVPGKVVIEAGEIEALDNYAFTTELDVAAPWLSQNRQSSADLHASFAGGFQRPDRIQGTLKLSGEFAEMVEQSGRPREAEIIVVPNEAWWRESDGEWHYVPEPYDYVDPYVLFATYATPRFYLEALRFESLVLPVEGEQKVEGVGAYHVRLDAQAILQLLPQGSGLRTSLGGDPTDGVAPADVRNADHWLPDDFVAEIWIAADEHYPARIVISLTKDDDYHLEPIQVDRARLQMDITDPDADFEIEVPETRSE